MTIDQIRTKTYFLTSTNSTSFPDASLIAEANNALDRVTSLIMQSDGRWQFDDENQTDLPIATTNLVANQQDYTLSIAHLKVTRVELQDSSGNWTKLSPIDQTDVYGQSLATFPSVGSGQVTSGLPKWYDKLGNSLFLYPSPSYSATSGLKVWFQRAPSYFLTSDTTKAPGFSSLYHELIPLWIAYNFSISNGKDNNNQIMQQIQLKEDALKDDYSTRDKDDHLNMRARPMRWN